MSVHGRAFAQAERAWLSPPELDPLVEHLMDMEGLDEVEAEARAEALRDEADERRAEAAREDGYAGWWEPW